MNAALVRQARRFLADATRCGECGLPKAEIATEWKGRGTGPGASLYTPTQYAVACSCPPKAEAPAPAVCPVCNGRGSLDVGAPPWIGEMPCTDCEEQR